MGLYVTRIEGDFLLNSLRTQPPGTVLDVGAGGGRMEPVILEHASAVVATEIARENLLRFPRDSRVHLVTVGAGQPSLPLRDSSVHAVVCLEVPAVSDEDWFFGECRRVLRPGGLVVVTVYNRSSYKGLVSRLLRRGRVGRGQSWANLYYRYPLSHHLERWNDAGFRVVRSLGFYWSPLPRGSGSLWVNVVSILERLLALRSLARFSPWVMLELTKTDSGSSPSGLPPAPVGRRQDNQ